jgi:hypothetical protein
MEATPREIHELASADVKTVGLSRGAFDELTSKFFANLLFALADSCGRRMPASASRTFCTAVSALKGGKGGRSICNSPLSGRRANSPLRRMIRYKARASASSFFTESESAKTDAP